MPVYKYKTEEYLNSEAWKKQTSIGTSWSLSMPKRYRIETYNLMYVPKIPCKLIDRFFVRGKIILT
jgi:hypothetical protein